MMHDNSYLTERFNRGFAYWIYGLMSLLTMFFVWKFVPETKAKTLVKMKKIWKK
jgi:SP family xylose:H+ symportor-like MFS transporter